jgi:hypothetical protein
MVFLAEVHAALLVRIEIAAWGIAATTARGVGMVVAVWPEERYLIWSEALHLPLLNDIQLATIRASTYTTGPD